MTGKSVFLGEYVIGTTWFDECILFHVMTEGIIFHKSFSLLRGFFQLQSCWFISDRCFERSTYFRFSPRKCLYQSSLLPTYHIYLPTFIFWLRFLYKLSFCDCFTFFFKEMFFKKTQNLSGSIFFQTRFLCFYK